MEGMEARRLLLSAGTIAGVLAAGQAGAVVLPTSRVVLATGGIGGLFLHTTNPSGSIGQGLALAARAGAALVDMEFVQFHPTALDTDRHPLPLVSEAVRGEGATLIDENGARFMADVPGGELAPRDVVARAVWRHLAAGHRVYLDTRTAIGRAFPQRFPVIAAACDAAGINPATQPIPIRPAAHYHMGGVAVDCEGRSTVEGLWVCGEVAGTGLHGANRLASNSLLEAVVCAQWVADSVGGTSAGASQMVRDTDLPVAADARPVQPILSYAAGVVRERNSLEAGVAALAPLVRSSGPTVDPALVALLIVVAASRRQESRGGHYRSDFPNPRAALQQRNVISLTVALEAVRETDGQLCEV
jgi:L-aspartate oxidase